MTSPMTLARLEIAPLLATRELWQLVSAAMSDPFHRDRQAILGDATARERLVAAAELLAEDRREGAVGPGELAPAELPSAVEDLFDAWDAGGGDLEVPYRALFGLSISQACPPCEIEYERNDDISFRAQRFADLAGFYRAFGLRPARANDERLDHIALQAELLALIAAREAVAREASDDEVVETCARARAAFFREHVGWWVPGFATVLNAAAARAPFYRAFARLAAALCGAERRGLGLDPFAGVPEPNPTKSSPEDECSSCPMGGVS